MSFVKSLLSILFFLFLINSSNASKPTLGGNPLGLVQMTGFGDRCLLSGQPHPVILKTKKYGFWGSISGTVGIACLTARQHLNRFSDKKLCCTDICTAGTTKQDN